METIQIHGVALEVRRLAGPEGQQRAPIVFLHEGLGSVAMWRDWPRQVCDAAGRAGVVYSRRGYGNSDPVPDVRGAGRLAPDYMHREAWDVLPALLQALGIERPVLLGHSDGGSIALLHASRHPVAACVVMAPHVIVEDVSVRSIEAARAAYPAALRERLKRYHADVDVAFWQWNDIWLSPAFRTFDIRQDCRRIEAPVLAIQGCDDPYGSMRQIEEIAPTRGSFRMEQLAGCGHSPHKDQPELTCGLVTQFLQALP
ncbi:alpha/beta fold hydrolase [Caenimonas terrae]|uniref:Alpha/beta fold hydrolase n=1 Tax=Caenimonas terrae TaxID=696074 RepID=A0ABW0NF29_9BURK